MSKSSTATVPKNPTPLPARSAWSKGPPQPAPSSRSQSPAPQSSQFQPSHSRRPSALGQGVPIKDGVSVPKNNVGAANQGTPVVFGTLDNISATISQSPAAAPAIKSDAVKSFGTVPATGHVNGKPSRSQVSTSPANPPASEPPVAAAATPPVTKLDIKKFFQASPSSQPSPDTASPSTRPINLPPQSSSHPPHPQPSQLGAHPFPPYRPMQNNGPNGGSRSPQYPRSMANGNAPRPQGGQNGGPSGLSSPRLGPNGQPSPMHPPPMPIQSQMQPQMQPQIQPQMHQMAMQGMQWPYYSYPPQDYQMYWAPYHMSMQTPMNQPQPLPGQHLNPHPGMPMSPRNPPSSLQAPGTPTLVHAPPNTVQPPHPPPPISHTTSSMGGLASPPNTPSSSSGPVNRQNPSTLKASTAAFTPRKTIVVKTSDGVEVDLKNTVTSNTVMPTPQGNVPRQGSPGAPSSKRASVRIETEDQRRNRLAEEEQKEKEKDRLKAEEEEKARKDKEEIERKEKEAEEQKRREEEAAKERIRKEEEERLKKERLKLEEEERLRKEAELREKEREAEERLRKEEEDRKRKDEEEAAKRLAEEQAKNEREEREREEQLRSQKEREEKEKAEQERLAKEAEEEMLRLEQEEAAKRAAEQQPESEMDGKSESTIEDGEVPEDGQEIEIPLREDDKEKLKESLRINTGTGTISPTIDKRRPGPLDLSGTKNSTIPNSIATARVISDINSIQYPEGISSPKVELNQGAREGKFRYDREFLLQFMSVCKEKPAMLPPLDAIGLEPIDASSLTIARGGSGRRQNPGSSLPPRANVGLGFGPGSFPKGAQNSFSMGNFGTNGPSKLGTSSDERFAMSTGNRVASAAASTAIPYNRQPPAPRTVSQGGVSSGSLTNRTRSKRGEKRGDNNKAPGGQQGHGGGGFNSFQNQQQGLEPVVPLQVSANRWDRKALAADEDSPEMVDRKVKGLLNKLTMEKFDSISDQIIAWANKSEKEKDGRTLIQVIRLVFEKATDEATWSEMYARLCRKMMEQISPKVQDDGIKTNEGKPIAGGQLFRKYLLNRCQEDFERGWVAKEATAAAAASKALEDEAVKAANIKTKEEGKDDEVALYSEEYYAAQKAKRQGLGLIKFIGELFKLQMLTERIMHECVKKLLGNVDNPEEEEIESLCKLLTTVGGILDTPKARAHLDVYFSRMRELTKSPNVTPRMQYMLQDLVELRERKWISRNAIAAPSTIAQIHEAAAKEKAAQEKESHQRQMGLVRGGSRRGTERSGEFPPPNPDGWAVAGSGPQRQPSKAGDLSNFGKINKTQPMTFGPSSVFAGKKGPSESKRESISRTSSNSNMFSMLSSQGTESGDTASKAAEPAQRKRLVLQPRSKPVDSEPAESNSPAAESEGGGSEDESALPEMTEAEAQKKIKEDTKEFFSVRNLEEAEVYFTNLIPQFHYILVDKLVSQAVESKEADAQLVSDFFEIAVSKELCSAASLEEGFAVTGEIIEDVAIDAPMAYQLLAIMMQGAKFDEERRMRLAKSDQLVALLH